MQPFEFEPVILLAGTKIQIFFLCPQRFLFLDDFLQINIHQFAFVLFFAFKDGGNGIGQRAFVLCANVVGKLEQIAESVDFFFAAALFERKGAVAVGFTLVFVFREKPFFNFRRIGNTLAAHGGQCV